MDEFELVVKITMNKITKFFMSLNYYKIIQT